MTDPLAYRALDAHVIAGRADHIALRDAAGTLSFAELLHESASIAGGLRLLGLDAGATIHHELRGRQHVVAVLALARLGLRPVEQSSARLEGEPAALHLPEVEPTPWEVLRQIGRVDPAPARRADEPEYEELLLDLHAEIFTPLIEGVSLDG